MAALQSERLSASRKILYGMGDWGFSLSSTVLSVAFAKFLTDVVHLDLGLAAAAVAIGRLWDWVNDPLVGYITDRTRSRWGRRRPFLLFGFLPFGLAFALLWWRPPMANGLGLAAYYGLAYLLYDTAATFVYMPYFALTPELTLDYDERTSLTGYRMFFSIVAGLVAFVVPSLVTGPSLPENAGRYLLMGVIFGAASALPLLGTFLGTRERPEFANQEQSSLREALQAVWRNPPFLFAAGIYLLTWMTIDLLLPILPYFLQYWLHLEAQQPAILGTIFVVAALALPLWNWATHRWNKRTAYIMGVAFLAAVLCAIAFVGPSAPLALILALAALAGIGVSAAHVLPWSIIPDAIEWDELATGKRHEGAFYSLVTLFNKVAGTAVVPGALLVLKWTGYVPNAATQTPPVQTALRFMVAGVPAVLLIGGIVFAALYPLDREKHRQVREEIAKRRAAG